MVRLALFPARIPETVMVTLGSTVQVFTVLFPSVRLPVTELVFLAFNVSAEPPLRFMFAEIFKPPVSVIGTPPKDVGAPVLLVICTFAPCQVRFPVPAFALKLEAPFQI